MMRLIIVVVAGWLLRARNQILLERHQRSRSNLPFPPRPCAGPPKQPLLSQASQPTYILLRVLAAMHGTTEAAPAQPTPARGESCMQLTLRAGISPEAVRTRDLAWCNICPCSTPVLPVCTATAPFSPAARQLRRASGCRLLWCCRSRCCRSRVCCCCCWLISAKDVH